MKSHQMYPAGQTRASRLKALVGCLDAEQGAASADTWLGTLRLARTDLEDETRLLPLVAFHSALASFAKQSPDGLDRTAVYFAARDNLGAWARILRVARSPEEAFERIESSDSEYGRTIRWEKIEGRPGYWRGRVRIMHDPKLEQDGLLADARGVELSIVPTLFGFPRGTVTLRERKEDVQEFEVQWPVPAALRQVTLGAASGVAVGIGGFLAHPSTATLAAAVVLPLLGTAVGVVAFRDRVRRIETAAQAMRVSALERSLALRDSDRPSITGDLENIVVAGQYRIGIRMGSGASGVIYQATRITDGLPVAIKLLRAAAVHDVTASDRLRREAEALGLSWHPNVVESIEHGHLPDGTSYLVMELLHGETLATRLNRLTRLSNVDIVPIAKQVAEALVAIHAAGVLHRDLKPSNIYLVPDDTVEDATRERVKVFDFGIARVEWEEMRITNVGAPLGTPGYMSPEQESGEEIDARSDIYAAGAVLYECFVGTPPPPSGEDMWKPGARRGSGSTRGDGERAIDSGVHQASRTFDLPPSSRVTRPVDVSPEWRALVERALAKRREDRFQDARALLAAIRRLEQTAVKPAQESSASQRS